MNIAIALDKTQAHQLMQALAVAIIDESLNSVVVYSSTGSPIPDASVVIPEILQSGDIQVIGGLETITDLQLAFAIDTKFPEFHTGINIL